MKYLIKIDQASVKTNPHAGQKEYLEQQKPVVNYYIESNSRELPEPLAKVARLQSETLIDGKLWKLEAVGEEGAHLIDIKQIAKDFNIKIECVVDIPTYMVRSIYEEPSYFYSYLPTEVICADCKGTFLHSELRSDINDEDGEDHFYEDVCPLCGGIADCQLEYEKL